MLSQNLRHLKENIPYHILSGTLYVLRHYLTTGNREYCWKEFRIRCVKSPDSGSALKTTFPWEIEYLVTHSYSSVCLAFRLVG